MTGGAEEESCWIIEEKVEERLMSSSVELEGTSRSVASRSRRWRNLRSIFCAHSFSWFCRCALVMFTASSCSRKFFSKSSSASNVNGFPLSFDILRIQKRQTRGSFARNWKSGPSW